MIIQNKQGDIILDLPVNSWEYTYWNLLVTSAEFEMPIMTEDKCAQLLVWLLHFGGGYEATTQNKKMYIDIIYSQYVFNIFGSAIPEAELIQKYNNELKSLTDYPTWAIEIFNKYNLKPQKFKV